MKKLSPKELVIMQEVWKADHPLTLEEVIKKVEGEGWSPYTVRSFLGRIVDKGFLEVRKKGRKNIYHPLVGEDYLHGEVRDLLGTLYKQPLTSFVSGLYRSDTITREDLKELKDYLDELLEASHD